MAKSALLGGRTVKVENRSGFDKSNLHLLTSKVGTITPIRKQLVIPSSGKCRVTVHAELPPLAADAYIRSHVKLEAFYCPLRLCYGGFQSWFSEEQVVDPRTGEFTTAVLPWAVIGASFPKNQDAGTDYELSDDDTFDFGPNSLSDYFGIHLHRDGDGVYIPSLTTAGGNDRNEYYQGVSHDLQGFYVNIFPYVVYQLIYHHYYRNKSIQTPLFAPEAYNGSYRDNFNIGYLPFTSFSKEALGDYIIPFLNEGWQTTAGDTLDDLNVFTRKELEKCLTLDGNPIFYCRQRNWGDDYFASAKPTAQQSDPVTVQVDADGKFTIASLRAQNALADFADVNRYATPDYVQACMARYGVAPSSGVVQKPVLLGSDDIPMFTKGVAQTAAAGDGDVGSEVSRNPFVSNGLIGSSAGKASANGSGFDFTFDVKEPGYVMIMATLVPEANYATGISKDMRDFTSLGSLVDLPCSLLENIGDEPISKLEVNAASSPGVFGYVQRYLKHKIGEVNQVSGLFRKGFSLAAFAPQRNIQSNASQISSNFLVIKPDALDDVAAVDSLISQYGVMYDTYIEMFVNEPLSESALPSLVDPAREHGKSVYLKNGGSGLA